MKVNRSCINWSGRPKVLYKDQKDAMLAIEDYYATHEDVQVMEYYGCPESPGFHIGHKGASREWRHQRYLQHRKRSMKLDEVLAGKLVAVLRGKEVTW